MLLSLLHIFEILLLAGSWAMVGDWLLPERVRQDPDRLLRWASAVALGAGATAVVLVALAMLHRFGRGQVRCVAAVGVLTSVVIAARHVRERTRGSWSQQAPDWFEQIVLVALGLVLASTLIATLAPPASMDATVYHLWVPKEFIRAGTWTNLGETHSFQPLYIEMLFGEGLGIGGGIVAALIHWALGLAAIAAAGAWSRRLGGSAILGAVIFGATALYVWESTSAFIDLGLTLFSSLAFLWATRTEEGWQPTALAGIFGGLAAGSKFTGLIAAALAALAGFVTLWGQWRRGILRLVIIGGLSVLVALPWYVRNLILTGNPIYPLANRWLGIPTAVLSSITYGLGRDPLHLLISPFDLIARGDAFDQGWSLGPAYLAFVPLGLAARRSRLAMIVVSIIAAWWFIWFYSSPQTRLLLPIMPMAAGLASVGVVAARSSSSRWLRSAAAGILAIAVLGALGTAALAAKANEKVALGLEDPGRYLERNSWNYMAYEEVNRLLPPDAKLAATGVDNNLYYVDREAIWLGQEIRSSVELRASHFTHELQVSSCPLPSLDEGRATLAEGTYPLRASRLNGGVYMQVCYRLSTVGPN